MFLRSNDLIEKLNLSEDAALPDDVGVAGH